MSLSILAKTTDIGRSEWLELRRRGIGGSDAAAVAGVSRWKSAVGVWLEKTGQVEDQELGEAAYWGTKLEGVVAEEFTERTGIKVRRRNAILQHPVHTFMLANIDREIIGQKIGLECKTTNAFMKDEWVDDNVPDAYYMQCQHYMAVTGFQSWYIAVLIGGNTFMHKLIERNEELIQQLIEIEKSFWQHVVNGTMPPADGTDASTEALRNLYPISNGQEIQLPDTAELWIRQYERAGADIKAAEVRKSEAQNALQQMLGENEVGKVSDRLVAWKTIKAAERFDSKAFQEVHPNLYKQYVKIGAPQRRFSIK